MRFCNSIHVTYWTFDHHIHANYLYIFCLSRRNLKLLSWEFGYYSPYQDIHSIFSVDLGSLPFHVWFLITYLGIAELVERSKYPPVSFRRHNRLFLCASRVSAHSLLCWLLDSCSFAYSEIFPPLDSYDSSQPQYLFVCFLRFFIRLLFFWNAPSLQAPLFDI